MAVGDLGGGQDGGLGGTRWGTRGGARRGRKVGTVIRGGAIAMRCIPMAQVLQCSAVGFGKPLGIGQQYGQARVTLDGE